MTDKKNIQLENLIAIQDLDEEIEALKKSADIIPGQINKSERELESKKSKLNRAQEKIDEIKKKRSQCEQDVKEQNDLLAKAKIKLPNVKTNKEYTAILTEVDTIKEKVVRIEDMELELMERLEEEEKKIPELKNEFNGYQKEYSEYREKKENEKKRFEDDLVAVLKKRDEIFSKVEAKLSSHYEKVVSLRGGKGVVALKGEICQGCFQHTQPQRAIEIKKSLDKIFQCTSCDRFLYGMQDKEEETEEKTAVSK